MSFTNCSAGSNSSGFSLYENGSIYPTGAGQPAYYGINNCFEWGATDVAKSSPAFAEFMASPAGVSFYVYYEYFDPFIANGFGVRCVKE